MTQRGFPFDAGEGLAYELDWSLMARQWLSNGIIRGVGSELLVFGDSSGMQVKIPTGHAWVRGHYYTNDAQIVQAITAAHPTLARIDRVVLRIDYAANTIRIALLTGTPAGSPAAPALTQTDSIYEYSLAQVAVAAGAGNIAAGNVTKESVYATGFQIPEEQIKLSNTSGIPVWMVRTGAVTGEYQWHVGSSGVTGQFGLFNVTGNRYEWYVTSGGTFTAMSGIVVASGGVNIVGGGLVVQAGGASLSGTIAITGALTVSSTINGQLISSTANFTGSLTTGSTLVVSAGGANITGPVAISTSLTVGNSMIITTGGANIGGNVAISGTVTTGTINGQTISSTASFTGSATFASGVTVGNGLTVTIGGIVVSGGGANITGNAAVSGSVSAGTTMSAATGFSVAAGGAAITGNSSVTGTLTVSSTINGQTISSSAAFTGSVSIATNLTVTGTSTHTGLTTFGSTAQAFATTNQGANASYGTFSNNTTYNMYVGLDNSVGGTLFASGGFAGGIQVPVNFVIRVNAGTLALNALTTGVVNFPVAISAGTGTFSTAGLIRFPEGTNSIEAGFFNSVIHTSMNLISQASGAITVGDAQAGVTLTLAASSAIVVNSGTGGIRPSTNGTADLGASGNRWGTVYAATGTINTSHSSAKQDMVPVIPGSMLRLARETQLYTYRYNLGGEADKHVRIGFKAEDTDELLSVDRASHDPASTAVAALGAVVDLETELRAEIAALRKELVALRG